VVGGGVDESWNEPEMGGGPVPVIVYPDTLDEVLEVEVEDAAAPLYEAEVI
jgi:hypothetical protein